MFEITEQLLQPIINIKDERIEGVEVLSRFKGVDTEEAFSRLRQAGARDVIATDMECLEMALGVLAAIPDRYYVGVNLNVATMTSHNLADRVNKRDKTPWRRVVFELIEEDQIEPLSIYSKIVQLRTKGIKLSMDDVGKAYNGPYRITQFLPDIVKIDKLFVRSIDRFPTMRAIVRSFVGMAAELRFKVVAEGVENKDELLWITAMGVEYAQGYHFCRPVNLEGFLAFVEEYEHSRSPGAPG